MHEIKKQAIQNHKDAEIKNRSTKVDNDLVQRCM